MLELPKNKKTYDVNTFNQLLDLINNQHWLEDNCEGLYYLWEENDNITERKLLEELLKRFKFVTSREMIVLSKKIVDKIIKDWGISNSGTKIVAFSQEKDPDGSQFFIQFIKNKFAVYDGWNSANFMNSLKTIGEVSHQLRDNQKIT